MSYIWIKHPKLCWTFAEVKDSQPYSTVVAFEDGTEMRINGHVSKHEEADKASLDMILDDLTDVQTGVKFSESFLLHQVRSRFMSKKFCTWISGHLLTGTYVKTNL